MLKLSNRYSCRAHARRLAELVHKCLVANEVNFNLRRGIAIT